MITCKIGEKTINCFDGTYDRDTLKKWSKKKILKCPVCGEDYTYNHGKVRRPYFKHLNSDCSLYGEPETDEHIIGKKDLYEWIKFQDGVTDVTLEGWLPNTKQRPDIMFKYNEQQYVIEYQCSPIATEYYERHELYNAAGIKDIWICGTKKYLQCYHDGKGSKQLNVVELKHRLYYDTDNHVLLKTVNHLNEKNFNLITDFETYVNFTYYSINYKSRMENFCLVKSYQKSFERYNYYPSGRPSNKYRYPQVKYRYKGNYSIAKYNKLNNIDFYKIINKQQ